MRAEVLRFIEGAKQDLGSLADRSGRVMYSSVETLRPGRLYTLGINPGADDDHLDCDSIRQSLDDLPNSYKSSYRMSWDRNRPEGSDPLQVNWIWLIEKLGFHANSVCASNIIFPRSRNAPKGREAEMLANGCWPVHERILRIVQPRFILAFGETPRNVLRNRLRLVEQLAEPFSANRLKFTCEVFRGEFDTHGITVIGVPHLGRRYCSTPPLPLDVQRLLPYLVDR
jgi:hypothetical protein